MAKKTILVVDDEPNSLFVTSQLLKDQSYQVITSENGNSALDKLKSEKINLVITDERMPSIFLRSPSAKTSSSSILSSIRHLKLSSLKWKFVNYAEKYRRNSAWKIL